MEESFKKIAFLGTNLNFPEWRNRNIIVTNSISIVCLMIIIVFCAVHHIIYPKDYSIYVCFFLVFVMSLIPIIQHLGYINLSRTLLTLVLVTGTLALTIVHKLADISNPSILTFYQSRTAIIFFSIVPLTTISIIERKLLVLNVLIGLATLLLYDPIHSAFGLDFYQLGFNDPNYYYINFVSSVIFALLMSVIGFFKYEMDKQMQENENLIKNLYSKNTLIEEQKEELIGQGEILKELLAEKDKDLLQVTHQLVNFNHELLQFSYTISHNLRGPVARTLGLIDLVKNYSVGEERDHLISLVLNETHSLDSIIRDLNKIVESRSDTFNVREEVDFIAEANKILELLHPHIKNYHIEVITELSVPRVHSSSKRINFILYTLISNAIQYRNPDKNPFVKIITRNEKEWIVLEVSDNGTGIDLDTYGDSLFKPFKSFHPNASGRGINLYLAKLQAIRLGGQMEVRSATGKGSTFSVYLKDWTS